MMTLGYDLGPHNQIHLPFADLIHQLFGGTRTRQDIAREQKPPGFGEKLSHFLVQSFDTGPAGGEAVLRLAGGALARKSGTVATVVALQAAGKAMLDQPAGAIGALQPEAAGSTER